MTEMTMPWMTHLGTETEMPEPIDAPESVWNSGDWIDQ